MGGGGGDANIGKSFTFHTEARKTKGRKFEVAIVAVLADDEVVVVVSE
jgi:hypothetical protein